MVGSGGWKQWQTLFSWAPKSLWLVATAMKLKATCSLEEKLWQTQHIKRQRRHFTDKGPYSQTCGFSSRHVQKWKLDHKEGWASRNQCFQTVVLEKTSESPLHSKKTKPANSKGNQHWIFIGRTDAETEALVLWPSDSKIWLTEKDPDAGKDWRQEQKGTTGWDGWMASVTQWTGIWASSGRWWGIGKPGVLQSMGSQRVGHSWATEQQQYLNLISLSTSISSIYIYVLYIYIYTHTHMYTHM